MTIGWSRISCDDCGRFMSLAGGASSAMIFDMVGMQPDHDRARCAACTKRLGPVRSNARPSNGDMAPYQSVHDEPDPRNLLKLHDETIAKLKRWIES